MSNFGRTILSLIAIILIKAARKSTMGTKSILESQLQTKTAMHSILASNSNNEEILNLFSCFHNLTSTESGASRAQTNMATVEEV